MRKILKNLIISVIFLISQVTASSEKVTSGFNLSSKKDICLKETLFDLFLKHEGKVLDNVVLSNQRLTKNYFKIDKNIYDKNAIQIGISNHPSTGSHHYYMTVGNKRFDGTSIFFRSTLSVFAGRPLLPKGVLFQISGNDELTQSISKAMNKFNDTRDKSCLHPICNILEEVGIEIKHYAGEKMPVSAEEFSKNLMLGNVLINNQEANIKMIATSADELAHYLKSLERLDLDVRDGTIFIMVVLGSVGSIFSGLLGTLIYFVIEYRNEITAK